MARSLYSEANTCFILCMTSSRPSTFRKLSCWPANEASGRSSAVADERTANEAPGLPALSRANSLASACRSSSGKGWACTSARISAPAAARACMSSVSRRLSLASMRSASAPCFRNSRNAWAVVAKPVGTRTPCGSCEIISPRLAFFPPTASTSVILRFSNGTTRAVGLKSADMEKLQKLKPGLRAAPWHTGGGGACTGRGLVVVLGGGRALGECGGGGCGAVYGGKGGVYGGNGGQG